jgi:hypothetical protein
MKAIAVQPGANKTELTRHLNDDQVALQGWIFKQRLSHGQRYLMCWRRKCLIK